MRGVCKIDGCDDYHRSLGLCNKHYLAYRRHGDPLIKTKQAKGYWAGVMCKVSDCNRQVDCKGLCSMHYKREKRLAEFGIPLKKKFQIEVEE